MGSFGAGQAQGKGAMLRYSTVAVAQRNPRSRRWVWTGAGIAATVGVAALTAGGPNAQHGQVRSILTDCSKRCPYCSGLT